MTAASLQMHQNREFSFATLVSYMAHKCIQNVPYMAHCGRGDFFPPEKLLTFRAMVRVLVIVCVLFRVRILIWGWDSIKVRFRQIKRPLAGGRGDVSYTTHCRR